MVVEKIDVHKSLEQARELLNKEKNLSPAFRSVVEVLIMLVTILVNRLGLNSRISSIPPSQDPNREKKKVRGCKRKPGGQKGRVGRALKKVAKPDKIEELTIDRRTLPPGIYKEAGYESRQVFEVNIELEVTEYRAQILVNKRGEEYCARFPDFVTKAVQYGPGVKAQSVYMSQFQLIPLERVKDYFQDQAGLPLSHGSIVNFNREAYEKLEEFENWAKEELIKAELNHADETSINVNGKKIWLHNLSNDKVTLYHADEKRGKEAMDRMGILPHYQGIVCHDHWSSYYHYDCTHSACNAHHLRELERAWEQDSQQWARDMKKLLLKINQAVDKAGGVLSKRQRKIYEKKYRDILSQGDKECPLPVPKPKKKRGRQKKSKARNLLERLREFEADTLRFMTDKRVPFTNNQGENDLRMTKVQQKISGCFRSMNGARIFCRVRSFLSTCRKNGLNPTQALQALFLGQNPPFMP